MLYSIQYLRAAAAILVVIYHATVALNLQDASIPTFELGRLGVDIFFVISGFIMWQTTAAGQMKPPRFLYKRLARIVPLYWLVTLTMFAMPSISGTIAGATQQHVDHLIASLFFIPYPYPAEPAHFLPVYVPGWSVNYEMLFYALFAASLFISNPGTRLVAMLSTLVGLVVAGAVIDGPALLAWFTSPLLLEFAAGVLVGAWHNSASGQKLRVASLAAATAVLVSTLVPVGFLGQMAGAALIVIIAVALEQQRLVPPNSALKFLGDASYSLYLTHLFAIGVVSVAWNYLALWTSQFGQLMFMTVAVAASIVLASLVHVLIEKPLLASASVTGPWSFRAKQPSK